MGISEIGRRLDRAQEHLDALNAELDAFATQKPYAFHVVSYSGNYVYDVEWIRRPPERWPLLVGDCVHNVRCALDHIVYELSGGRMAEVPRYAEFPIFKDKTAFFQRTKKGKAAPGSGLRKIESVTNPNARTAIRGLQPFQRPDPLRDLLWILHELNNFDKHRALHVVFGYMHTNLANRGVFDVADLPRGWRQARATQGPMYVANLPPGPVDYNVKMRFDLAMRVTLPPKTVGAYDCVDVVLADILNYVRMDVLDALGPFLPEHTAWYD